MIREYLEVDNDGNIIEVHALNPDVDIIPPNYFEGWGNKVLFSPKWDFTKNDWVESLTEEEIFERKQKIEEEKNKLTNEELNAMAIMELAKMLMEKEGE